MLSISEDTVLKIKTSSLKNTPRDIYLVGGIETAKKLFNNAYVIPYVKWYKFVPVYELFTGEKLETPSEGGYPALEALEKSVLSKIDALKPQIKSMQTVIPFSPSKRTTESVTDWKMPETNLMTGAVSLFGADKGERWYSSRARSLASEAKMFMQLLLENANAMSIILRGVHYDSPCKFCASIYNRIIGECELFNSEKYYRQTCQPRVTFAAQLFEGDNFDLTEELDLSKDLMRELLENQNQVENTLEV